jgi:hypothetical protein
MLVARAVARAVATEEPPGWNMSAKSPQGPQHEFPTGRQALLPAMAEALVVARALVEGDEH